MRFLPAPHRAVLALAIALAMIVMGMTVPSQAAPGSAFVRVNQVGYPADSAKRAYLMSSAAETGATFAVKTGGGATLFSGRSASPSGRGATPIRSSTRSTSQP